MGNAIPDELTPTVVQHEGRWAVRMGERYYRLPAGTTREQAEQRLLDALEEIKRGGS